MADFCIDCWNKLNNTYYPPSKFILSKDLDLCEGCGEYKRVIEYEFDDEFGFLTRNIFVDSIWLIKKLFKKFKK